METKTSKSCASLQQDDDLGTNQQTEKTSVPATMAFKLHSNQGIFMIRYN